MDCLSPSSGPTYSPKHLARHGYTEQSPPQSLHAASGESSTEPHYLRLPQNNDTALLRWGMSAGA
jgi:hypothetical protein